MNNRVSPLSPESFFFTDEPTKFAQSASQAYGPVSGNETTQYSTSASFTVTGTAKLFAICKGQVFLQPNEADANKVNLLLRPYTQPINGLSIKYFVYRGLKKSDFIQGTTDNLIGHSALGGASEFINVIWNQLKTFNQWDDATADSNHFEATWIGYDPLNQSDDAFIDDFFFNVSVVDETTGEESKSYELPIVSGGTELGTTSGAFALDVVLSDGDYKAMHSDTGFEFDLAFAKANTHKIDIATLPTGVAEKQYREAILDFIDPAAYYGLHVDNGTVQLMENGAVVKKQGQLIYDEFLSRFHTKNNVYICIQSNLGRSYDYYGNYSSVNPSDPILKMGVAEDAMIAISVTTNDWPIMIQNEPQSHTEDINGIYVQFTVGNEKPLCFGQLAKFGDEAEDNFIVAKQLLATDIDNNGETTSDSLTLPVQVFVPAVSANGVDKMNVTSLIKIIYQSNDLLATEIKDGDAIFHRIKAIDTLFDPVDILPRFAGSGEDGISWNTNTRTKLLDTEYIDSEQSAKIALQTKVVFDKFSYAGSGEKLIQERRVYETQLIQGVGGGLYNRNNSISRSSESGQFPFSVDNNNFHQLDEPYAFEVENSFSNNVEFDRVHIKSFSVTNQIDKYCLGISELENDTLKLLSIQDQIVKPSVFLQTTLYSNEDFYTANDGSKYRRYVLGIVGEDTDGNLKISKPDVEIIVYSFEAYNMYYSLDYVKYMPSTNAISDNELIIEVEE